MDSPFSVADLSHQMRDFSIQQPHRRCYTAWQSSNPPSEPSSPSTIASNSSFSTTTPNTPPMTPLPALHQASAASSRPNSYHNTNIRAQRQRAIKNQCTAGHLDEIAALVSRMVNSGEQCSVCSSSSRPPSPTPASTSMQSPSSSHRPITLARQNSDSSDGSVSPFSRAGYAEDEHMDDIDQDGSAYDMDAEACADGSEYDFRPGFGEWSFSWGARPRPADSSSNSSSSSTERKCFVAKDTRSRKQQSRRRG